MSLMYDSKKDVVMTLDQLHNVKTPDPIGRFHQSYPFAELKCLSPLITVVILWVSTTIFIIT